MRTSLEDAALLGELDDDHVEGLLLGMPFLRHREVGGVFGALGIVGFQNLIQNFHSK